MASAAEQLVSNINFRAFSRATELKKRLLFTLGALLVFRLGTYIPIPGINTNALEQMLNHHSNGILGLFNVFAGGAVGRMAIFALGIMPYISASIIFQLLTAIIPSLEALKKEGEAGRKIITQYTRYATVLLATLQAYGLAIALENGMGSSYQLVLTPGWIFRIVTVVTLVAGTMFLVWLGEQITSRGVGNGSSLIIFSGIAARLPLGFYQIFSACRQGNLSPVAVLAILALIVAVLVFVIFAERAQRRLLVQYPKRQVGNKIFQGESSHLPLKLNTAGVIPPIFASSLLMLPATINNFVTGMPHWFQSIVFSLNHGQPAYLIAYALLITFFSFFYTAVVFNPQETAEQLKKQSGFIPGIRPGQRTAEYIDYVLTRVTVLGTIYIVVVCLFPEIIRLWFPVIPFQLGGTSLMIAVTVTLDTIAQIQGHLMAHQYESLIKRANLRSGKRRSR